MGLREKWIRLSYCGTPYWEHLSYCYKQRKKSSPMVVHSCSLFHGTLAEMFEWLIIELNWETVLTEKVTQQKNSELHQSLTVRMLLIV